MKTPPAPTKTVVTHEATTPATAATRWDHEAPVRIVVEQPETPTPPVGSGARERLKARVMRDYPHGKALERARYFDLQRGLPGPTRPLDAADSARRGAAAARSARRIAAALLAVEAPAFRAAMQLPAWRELGPTLIPHGQTYGSGTGARPAVSGRCNGLVIDRSDPRHLVLCSAGGGLWGSADAGATWAPLTDNQPTLVMGALVQAPSAPHVMYAGTGEGDSQIAFGVGLLRSSDGGRTWSHVPSPALTGVAVYALAVHPTDPLQVWIASTAGLHVSANGGGAARSVLPGPCWSVTIHPLNPREMFAAVETGLMRSTDGGTTWRPIALAGAGATARFMRLAVAQAPSQPDIVVAAGCLGTRGLLWRRATAGGAFAAETAPAGMDLTQAWYDWCLGIGPDDPDRVYWGAIDLYRGQRSPGAGYRWTRISSRSGGGTSIHPDQHGLAFDSGGTVYACNDGGLFRSHDGGDSWESLNPGLGITEFEYLAQLESDPAWILGGTQDNGSLAHGALRRWDQVALGDGGDCASVDRAGASICYHSYYDMPVERAAATGDQAFDWTDVSPPVPDGYAALFYPPLEARGSVVAKAGATLWVSDDEGAHWEEVALPTSGDDDPDVASALAIAEEHTIVIGTAAGRLYRVQRGAGWSGSQVTALAALPGAYISDIAVVGTTGRTLWVSCSRPPARGGRVFRSTDGGRTWLDRSSTLPELAVNALVVDPKNSKVLYAATDRGVQRTRDSGVSWSDFSNGLPNVIVGDLLLHAGQRRLRAGTRSRGAWEVDV
jgi:photosystem II stability/assembly factor-like uncharacterized protein